MKILIAYDSQYGNTERIAQAVGKGVDGEVQLLRAGQVDPEGLDHVDLLVVGSPTQGGRPTKAVQDLLARLPEALIKGKKVAAFDTRYGGRLVKVFGFAADRISENLTSKGGTLVSPPEAFIVEGKKGPLREGELERAARWAKDFMK